MTQVDAAIKIQLSSVINEMKLKIKDMFKGMVKEMTSPRNTTPSSVNKDERKRDDTSDEEEKDEEEMEISSSDEDSDLYTEQVTTPDRSILRAHKKKISS